MTFISAGSEFLVNTDGDRSQNQSATTVLDNGNFVIAWTKATNNLDYEVRTQLFSAAGVKIGTEIVVVGESAAPAPVVTGLAGGGFVIAWQGYGGALDPFDLAVKAQRFDAAGVKLGGELVVNTAVSNSQGSPSIATLANGGFVVSWATTNSAQDGHFGAVKAQIFDAAGSMMGTEFLVNTDARYSQSNPSVAALAGGGFVVHWSTMDSGQNNSFDPAVKGQVFTDLGAKIGSEYFVNTLNFDTQYEHSLTRLAGGGYVAAWSTQNRADDGSELAIKAQVFDATGAKIGAEFLVNSKVLGSQQDPSISALKGGGFVISWTDYYDTRHLGGGIDVEIRAQAYSASGAREGGEFLVNTQTASFQQQSAVTGLADGGFLISWTTDDFSQDGSLQAIKAQRFAVEVIDPYTGVTINGTLGKDTLSPTKAPVGQPKATALGDKLYGLDGDDTLDGGAGGDLMTGGNGNDKYMIDNALDVVVETIGGGTKDLMQSSTISFALADNVENGTLLGTLVLGMSGNDLANQLIGNSAANLIHGGAGKDKIDGKAGNDFLFGDGDSDILTGDLGNDTMNGGDGADTLNGGRGADLLAGGSGADKFAFDDQALFSVSGVEIVFSVWGGDKILDFSGKGGEGDKIVLSAIDANGIAADGNQKFVFLGNAAFTGAGAEVRTMTVGSSTIVLADIDGDQVSDFNIELAGVASMQLADFVL
jgi:Ca2+-binding RTX toxin-like protein